MPNSGPKRSALQALLEPIYDFLNDADLPAFDAMVLTICIMGCGMGAIFIAWLLGALSGVGTDRIAKAHPLNESAQKAYSGRPHPGFSATPHFSGSAPGRLPYTGSAVAAPQYVAPQVAVPQFAVPSISLSQLAGSHFSQKHFAGSQVFLPTHPYSSARFGRPRSSSSFQPLHAWYPFAQEHCGEAEANELRR